MLLNKLEELLKEVDQLEEKEKIDMLNRMRGKLYEHTPKYKIELPCLKTILVPVDKVVSNDYNPNKVANPEMRLLKHSIVEDGLTMSIVAFYDEEVDKYIVVDGFHRYTILKDKLKMEHIPLSLIEKDIKDRMASTVRHNRARGVHKVDLQAEMVVDLIRKGWDDADISKHLGMDYEEVLRLKQVTGVKEVFRGREHSRSWIIDDSDRGEKK